MAGRKFFGIAFGIALGVAIVGAGVVIAAPSLVSLVTGVRPIESVIAGLDRNAARGALAREAFPDEAGRAFMARLATHFPQQHDDLLDTLADAAAAGADRDALVVSLHDWLLKFGEQQLPAIGRSGADGFDRMLAVGSDAIRMLDVRTIDKQLDSCTLQEVQKLLTSPAERAALSLYGLDGYEAGLRAGQTLIDLAVSGRETPSAGAMPPELTPADETALQSIFISLMADPQVMSMVRESAGLDQNLERDGAVSQINVCRIARKIIDELEALPPGTKARLIAQVGTGDAGRIGGAMAGSLGSAVPEDTQAHETGVLP